MPVVGGVKATKVLEVAASVWELGKAFTHKGVEHRVENYEQCRTFAQQHGYSKIRITYK